MKNNIENDLKKLSYLKRKIRELKKEYDRVEKNLAILDIPYERDEYGFLSKVGVAHILGVSRSRIAQIETSAMKKLRTSCEIRELHNYLTMPIQPTHTEVDNTVDILKGLQLHPERREMV